jgi:hexosaminidase
MPGHTTAWLAAYPELASAPGPYRIEHFWGVRDPCLDPTRESVYLFLDQFIGEMAAIFTDEYFHIGGDEVNGRHWNANAEIRDFKERHELKDNHALQAYFNQRLLKILEKHGKRMIGWDEILHPDLPKNVTVQSWRGMASLANSVARGNSGILSYGYYLDHMQSAAFHYAIDPQGKEAAALGDKEKTRILGGEACMWGEFITEENIESRIWPRTAAIAERLWSPATLKDEAGMYRRLQHMDPYLASLGLRHRSQYSILLQRLAGEHDPAPLRLFADLLEPSGLGVRARTRKYSRLIPLNRMVDAIPPESEPARQFAELVNRALHDPAGSQEDFQKIREHLNLWDCNQALLRPIVSQSFLLHEIEPLTEIVLELCAKGLQALDYIETGRIPSKEWHSESVELLGRSGKPMAEMTVAIVPAIEMLIEAANKSRRDR